MKKNNFCIPIYLNQKVVFDLLAIMEDGFSQFRAVKTSESESELSKADLNAKFGVSNVFALLGVSLSGSLNSEEKKGNQKEYSEEKVHTPTSLFSKMRESLIEDGALRLISLDQIEKGEIKMGEFVEFEGILRKNPMVHAMQVFVQFFETFMVFAEKPTQKGKRQGGGKQPVNENEIILEQMKIVLNDLIHSNSIDIIVDIEGKENVQAVLSTQLDYFNDRNASEIIDGRFKVLGKVTRTVENDSGDSINLLRKSSFGVFETNMLNEMINGFQDVSAEGLKLPKLITEVKGPAIQVIPIAIFV